MGRDEKIVLCLNKIIVMYSASHHTNGGGEDEEGESDHHLILYAYRQEDKKDKSNDGYGGRDLARSEWQGEEQEVDLAAVGWLTQLGKHVAT